MTLQEQGLVFFLKTQICQEDKNHSKIDAIKEGIFWTLREFLSLL